MKKLHIAIVTPDYPPTVCGLAQYAHGLAQGLVQLGHTVSVLVPVEQKDSPEQTTETLGLWVHRFDPLLQKEAQEVLQQTGLQQMAASRRVAELLKERHQQKAIDLIEFSNWKALGYYFLLQKKIPSLTRLSTGILQVYADHPQMETAPDERALVDRLAQCEKSSVLACDMITVASTVHWQHWSAQYGIDPHNLPPAPQIIPLGIPIPEVDLSPRPKSAVFTILFIGRLTRRKGFDLFMEAMALVATQLPDHRPNIAIQIIGRDMPIPGDDQSMWEKYRDLIPRSSRLSIDYLGEVSDEEKNQAYAQADLLVAPSRYESFGLCFVEAMSYALPVIALAIGGSAVTVPHEQGGILVEEAEAEAIAQEVRRFLEGKRDHQAYREMAYQYALEHYSVEKMVDSTLAAYYQMLDL